MRGTKPNREHGVTFGKSWEHFGKEPDFDRASMSSHCRVKERPGSPEWLVRSGEE